ncbi:MAG: MFS transporter [Eubacteriaceae bacterium]|nr:MFS transporter [Eubacteriaceae bacterium]
MKKIDYKWIALSCTTLGALFSVLSGTTLVVALPVIMKDLNTSMSVITWTIMGYMLVMTILVPSIGRMGDMYGRKKLYVSGFAIFTFASLLCGLSQSGIQLIIFRLIQAIGGALILANGTAIVADTFSKKELGKALGLNISVISVAIIIGPILGGFLMNFGWRSIFYINIPIGIIVTLWSAFQLKEMNKITKKQTFDLKGTLSFTAGVLFLLTALSLGGFIGWLNPYILLLFVFSIALMALFVYIETNSIEPMLDLRLFKTRVIAFAYISNLLNGLARGAVTFLLIFYFQGVKGLDPLTAGLLLSPFAIAMMLVSPFSGGLSDRFGTRILSSVGLLITAVGLGGLMMITENTSIIEIILWMFIMGFGSGMFFSPNTSSIMGSVPPSKRGIAAGVNTMMSNAGALLSIALSMAIISSSISPDAMQALFLGTQIGANGIAINEFVAGLRMAFTISFVFSLTAALMSYLRGPKQLWKEDENSLLNQKAT